MICIEKEAIELLAFEFAVKAHAGQKRKWSTDDYIVHPIRVAQRIKDGGGSTAQVCAAYLHDVVEDCKVPIEEIERVFGAEIAGLVFELTEPSINFPHFSRSERRKMDREFYATISLPAKEIKVADIFDNIGSILTDSPLESREEKVVAKKLLLAVVREGNEELAQVIDAMIAEGGF